MPFSPGVTDQSGQILGQSIGDFGQLAGAYIDRQKQLYKQQDKNAKALQSLTQSHPELMPQGLTADKLRNLGPAQQSQIFEGLTQATDLGLKLQQANYYGAHANLLGALGQSKLSAVDAKIYDEALRQTGDPTQAALYLQQFHAQQGQSQDATASTGVDPSLAQSGPAGVLSRFQQQGGLQSAPMLQSPIPNATPGAGLPGMLPMSKTQAAINLMQAKAGAASRKGRAGGLDVNKLVESNPVMALAIHASTDEDGQVDPEQLQSNLAKFGKALSSGSPAAQPAGVNPFGGGAPTNAPASAPTNYRLLNGKLVPAQ